MIAQVSSKLKEMPPWANVPPDKPIDHNKIIEILREIDKYPSVAIRQGITVYYTSMASVEEMGWLLLLNKFLFNLPEWIPVHLHRRFGGWLGVPEKQGQLNLLWPFSPTGGGDLLLTGRFTGYMGDAYLALEAFDYYLKTYGRRNARYCPKHT